MVRPVDDRQPDTPARLAERFHRRGQVGFAAKRHEGGHVHVVPITQESQKVAADLPVGAQALVRMEAGSGVQQPGPEFGLAVLGGFGHGNREAARKKEGWCSPQMPLQDR